MNSKYIKTNESFVVAVASCFYLFFVENKE